jgi:MoaA/NifB/PqqE/SkfB family radical SAM enzyme
MDSISNSNNKLPNSKDIESTKKFRQLKRRYYKFLNQPQLKSIFIGPSHDCNADCVHCYEKFCNKEHFELSSAKINEIINQFKKLGGDFVHYCSGEFLLREDAVDLVRYASQQNMRVSITSNGILADEAKIEELKSAGLTKLVISIDSADERRHDELRRVNGCFQKAVSALKIAKEKGLVTKIWTYVSRTNFNELEDIAELAKKLQTNIAFVYFPLLSGHMFNSFEENLTFEEREMYRQKYNGKHPIELEFPTEESLCRGGGNEHICVLPSGDVTFCPPVPYSYGNVHDKKLKDILKLVVADYKKFCTKKCTGQCIVNFPEYRDGCNAKYIYK